MESIFSSARAFEIARSNIARVVVVRENRLEGKKTGRLNSALSLSQNIEY